MYSRPLIIFLTMMFLASCVNRGVSPPAVIDVGCDRDMPIYLSDHDIDVMDMQTKRAVLAHNKTW
jgi:hypothetical protein